MKKQIGAIITGGDFQGLGVLRSLATREIPIILTDCNHCIGRFSKYKKSYFKSPHPSKRESYLNFLINLAEKFNVEKWIIFPNSDETVYILSKYKSILEKYYLIPTSDWEIIKYIYIKKNTYQLANSHGIPIPATYYPTNMKELRELNLDYPVVLKPSVKDNFYNIPESVA